MSDTNNPEETAALDRAAELLAKVTEFVTDKPAIHNEDDAKTAAGFVDEIRKIGPDVKADQATELAPHEEAADRVKARYSPTLIDLRARFDLLKAMAGDWLARERKRIADEKAAQLAEARRLREEADRAERERIAARERENEEALRAKQEAERDPVREAEIEAERQEAERRAAETQKAARDAERAAASKPVAAAIKAGTARAMTLTTRWRAVVTDEAAAIESFKDHPDVRAAALAQALKLASATARALKSEQGAPAGFRFIKEETA